MTCEQIAQIVAAAMLAKIACSLLTVWYLGSVEVPESEPVKDHCED